MKVVKKERMSFVFLCLFVCLNLHQETKSIVYLFMSLGFVCLC